MELHPEGTIQWASLHFAVAKLVDARRVKRAKRMAVAMLRAPGESLPRLFTQPRELKAAYRCKVRCRVTLDNPHLDPGHVAAYLEGLQAGHLFADRGQLGVLLLRAPAHRGAGLHRRRP